MSMGLVGRKLGMMRLFAEDGAMVPVTVVLAEPNRVVQVKQAEQAGYSAVQVTQGSIKPSRLNKAEAGHFAKMGAEIGRGLWEFRLSAEEVTEYQAGQAVPVNFFKPGDLVDVTGRTIGKGFAGVIKRHHFNAQDMTHGNSRSHRAPGSIGQRQTPGRVFKRKRMAGHLGDVNQTIQNLRIAKVDVERNLLMIEGAVPGAKGGDLVVRPAVKCKKVK